MTRKSKTPSQTESPWPMRLEHLALILVLVTICGRATLQERSESEQLSVVNRLQGGPVQIGGAGPATSLVLNGLILAATGCCAMAAAVRGGWHRRYRGLLPVLMLLTLAAAASMTRASNLRLALNESINRLCAVLVLIVIVQTVRRWWQVRWILAAIGATAVSFAAFGITQVFELEDTLQWIQQQKDEAVQSGRIQADDPMLQLLERRALAGEVSGFFSHSNIAGSYLMACCLATVALGLSRFRAQRKPMRRVFGVIALIAAGVMAVVVWLSGSRGAILAGALCGFGWGALWLLGRLWPRMRAAAARRWRLVLGAGWLAAIGLIVAVVLYGLVRGGLPRGSLGFRWQYWTGAARIVASHPILGVGAGNFDRHYLRYKPAEAPEEVRDPHNYLVSVVTEWGALGLAGTVLLLVVISVALVAPPGSRQESGGPRITDRSPSPGVVVLWGLPVLIGVLIARSIAGPPQLWVIWALAPSMIWAIAYMGLSLDSDQPTRFEDDALVISGGLAAALLAVMLHNMISFSMIYPGTACTFFALAGVAMSVRRLSAPSTRPDEAAPKPMKQDASSRSLKSKAGLISSVVLVAAVMYWPVVLPPVISATSWLQRARESEIPRDTLASYEEATRADPIDPVAPAELASWAVAELQRARTDDLDLAEVAVAAALKAVNRDAEDNRNYRTLAGALAMRYTVKHDPNDVDLAVMATDEAVRRYPELPSLRIDYAEVLVLKAMAHRDRKLLDEAVAQLDTALRLDDRRLPREVRRFTRERREAIARRMRELQSMELPTSLPSSGPGHGLRHVPGEAIRKPPSNP
ncbi:MAG: O-antigen ligase family protein [Phycisphaerae bacterium]|nr:O-antigen ligase family protein [Phycisphaerae bacterium]